MNQDEEYLKILSLFHYILGGVVMFFSMITFVYIGLGIAMLTGKLNGKDAPPHEMGWFFVIIGSIGLLFGWTLGILMITAGRKLRAHRARIYCLVIAVLECLFSPLGTALGAFTIIMLAKIAVIEMFEANKQIDNARPSEG
jgi:hypothetical protein